MDDAENTDTFTQPLPRPVGHTLRDMCQRAIDDGRFASMREIALDAGMAPETLSRLLACHIHSPGHLLLVGLATALGSDICTVSDALLRQLHGARQ